MARLRRFLIERDIPGVGGMSIVELCGARKQLTGTNRRPR